MVLMSEKAMTVLCNRCDVSVSIVDMTSDQSRVECPVCGADFGTWGKVRQEMLARIAQPYRDRDSWRTVER